MNTFSKVVSMFLVVVMCFGLFATGAYADGFDFSSDSTYGGAQSSEFAFNSGFSFEAEEPAANDNSFEVQDALNTQAGGEFALKEEAETVAEDTNKNEDGSFSFEMSDTNTFDKSYEDKEKDGEEDQVKIEEANGVFWKNAPEDIAITKAEYNTFSRYKYVLGTNFDSSSYVPESALKRDTTTMKISKDWLLQLDTGYYTFWGIKQSDGMPIRLGNIQVNAGDYSDNDKWGVTVYNSPYVQPAPYDLESDWDDPITASGVGIPKMEGGFGIAAVSGGYTHVLVSGKEYLVSGSYLEIFPKYLNTLSEGEYYLIGFPVEGRTSEQPRLGKFTVVASDMNTSALGLLTPDYQVWYSGTDPLTFYCDIFDAAGRNWNYAGYGWDVIIPDIRVSTRSGMSGATSVRIDQYWDLGYGYFMLGQNFLSSLSADETYYMQVVDARHPNILYSNIVSFRVGPTLRAIDTDKHVINSTRSLRFRSSSPVAEVYVGNIQLTDAADYGVSWDGKTVTLSFEFLNKRSAGNTYTIKVRTTDGEWAATTFQVLTTAQGSASPRTGDESNLGLWAAFLLLSGTAVVVLVPKLRKQDF